MLPSPTAAAGSPFLLASGSASLSWYSLLSASVASAPSTTQRPPDSTGRLLHGLRALPNGCLQSICTVHGRSNRVQWDTVALETAPLYRGGSRRGSTRGDFMIKKIYIFLLFIINYSLLYLIDSSLSHSGISYCKMWTLRKCPPPPFLLVLMSK